MAHLHARYEMCFSISKQTIEISFENKIKINEKVIVSKAKRANTKTLYDNDIQWAFRWKSADRERTFRRCCFFLFRRLLLLIISSLFSILFTHLTLHTLHILSMKNNSVFVTGIDKKIFWDYIFFFKLYNLLFLFNTNFDHYLANLLNHF